MPEQHRTDHLSAAVKALDADRQALATSRYQALMDHYGVTPTTNNAGLAHENGDVEQAHYRFKVAVDQALRVRGSRDFASRAAYHRFLSDLVRRRNQTRQRRWEEEQRALRPLPIRPVRFARDLRLVVSPFSTIRVLRNTYSVPSRLIGRVLTVRLRSETVELYHARTFLLAIPRLLGEGKHRIDYRHVIWSLVRKPGAFAGYRYRDELFPGLPFRAASTSEADVEAALNLLAEARTIPTFEAVRRLVRDPRPSVVPALTSPEVNLHSYDQLLAGVRHA